MCRSALEYPPNGKRCAGANHLAMKPAEYDAWRLKRNARERELYHIRKAAKNKAAAPTPTTTTANSLGTMIEEGRKRLQRLGISEGLITGEKFEDIPSTSEQAQKLRSLLFSEQSDLAYIPVRETDVSFEPASINTVERVILEDGTVGYFKHFADDDNSALRLYELTPLESSLNEVAAYKLSQIMGEGYDDLVPETVFREYDGQLGTLQKEALGDIGKHYVREGNQYQDGSFDVAAWRRAAIFDIVAGAVDRHIRNFIVQKDENGKYIPKLIDNGFGFLSKTHRPSSDIVDSHIILADNLAGKHNSGPVPLNGEEEKAVLRLRDSSDLEEMKKVLTEDAYSCMLERIGFLLDRGIYNKI